MNLSTLYVTDLDGTLLNDKTVIEKNSLETLNSLINNGALFSIATGRSYTTAKNILDSIDFTLPVLLLNGVHIFDWHHKKTLYTMNIDCFSIKKILKIFRKTDICPIFYVMKPDGNVTLFYDHANFDLAKRFIADRSNFFKKEANYDAVIENSLEKVMINHSICFIIALAKDESTLSFAYEELKKVPNISFHFYKDKSIGALSIEIFSNESGKDRGIAFLKEFAKAERVISFGDNYNDISMKKQSDVFCVVENALDEVKKYADIIIPSNNDAGVITYITDNLII